jgi:2-polyprenyl-6-methoxyphenol hydroxylase-like FAD-dependent oxidoreductase
VGAGTAGSAAALLLARAGHQVTLFEAVRDPQPVGAGIMMQPSGLVVLDELGLLPQILARGAPISGLHCHTSKGREVLRVDYARLAANAFGVGLHRGVLFDALIDAAQAEPGVDVRLGHPVTRCGFEDGDGGKSGASPRGGAGERPVLGRPVLGRPMLSAGDGWSRAFDLVVVANGARSELRKGSGLTRRDKPYPWGALWLVLEDPQRIFEDRLAQVVEGTREMLGFLPSGLGPSGDTPLVSLFWSLEATRVDEFRRAPLGRWKERVLELMPRCAPLLEQVRDMDQLLFAGYRDVVMRQWHQPGGVVFLGDAAHAMSPQLGQGANLALVDAATLRDSLASEGTVADALAAYSRARRHELGYYQWSTRMLTPFFQSHWGILGWLRDWFMSPLSLFPYSANKMTRTLCGLERGVLLSRAKALPALSVSPPRLLPPNPGR